MKLAVGQRDETHRLFLGWRIQTDDDFQLGSDGNWYNVADVWTDRTKARRAMLKKIEAGAITADRVRLVRVFATEPPLRRALRELIWACEHEQSSNRWVVLESAKRAVEES